MIAERDVRDSNVAQPVVSQTRLESLRITQLRVLHCINVNLDSDLIVLAGPNGSGKTSVLEAVHMLATGRSFRSRSTQDIVTFGEDRLQIYASGTDAQRLSVHVGIEKPRHGPSRFRVNGTDAAGVVELARRLPCLLITPDSQRLLSDGSETRRRLVDWLMFHVEPTYHEAHRAFRQALRQRNSLLRSLNQHAAVADAWDHELVTAGQRVHELRMHHAESLQASLTRVLAALSQQSVAVKFHPGWNVSEETFAELLPRRWNQDVSRGYTVYGPQRADLVFSVRGRAARDVLSRGESKLLAISVQIAMAHLLRDAVQAIPIMLVDELASELDASNRERFFQALRITGAQTFVTTVDADLVTASGWPSLQIFDVSAGQLRVR